MAAKAARKSSHSCEPSSTTLPRKDPKAELEERDRQASSAETTLATRIAAARSAASWTGSTMTS
jgi:hypothetical protein